MQIRNVIGGAKHLVANGNGARNSPPWRISGVARSGKSAIIHAMDLGESWLEQENRLRSRALDDGITLPDHVRVSR
jgi:hypothetical protein